jgi:hypothetical protein
MQIVGLKVLESSAASLGIDLTSLVAANCFWAPCDPVALATTPMFPNVRRARKGGARGRTGSEGAILDDNTKANSGIKRLLRHVGKFVDFAVCHIWDKTCYDTRYHTLPANLVLLPRALAGLTDHHPHVIACLRYRAWELYKWYPDGEEQPVRPDNYPKNWQQPRPLIQAKKSSMRPRSGASSGVVLPVFFQPETPSEFKTEFLERRKALIEVHFQDGSVTTKTWIAHRFNENSNLIGNIRSRSDFRGNCWVEKKITKVLVKVD